METYTDQTRTLEKSPQRDRVVGGTILIGLGLLFLLGQFFNIGLLVLPILGIAFMVAGIATRKAGFFVPAGILSGIALGTFLIEGPYTIVSGDEARGGVFLLSFALGWAGITLLSTLFTDEPQRWPLIPGGIMALIGAALLAGSPGLQLLQIVGYLWPLALIAAGLAIIFRHLLTRNQQ